MRAPPSPQNAAITADGQRPNRRKRRRATALLALAFSTMAGTTIAATTSDQRSTPTTSTGTLVTAPARQVASITPGGSSTFSMVVQNRLGRTATIDIVTHDLAPGADAYSKLVEVGAAPRGAGRWLTPEAGTLTLRDGERRTFEVGIRVPASAGPGGHFGAVTAQVRPESKDDGRVGVGVRIASNVTVLVPGSVSYDGRARKVRLTRASAGQIEVAFTAEVTGNIQTTPAATITLRGPFNTTRTSRVAIPETLPGGTRAIRTMIDAPVPIGPVSGTVRLQFEDQTHRLSRRSNELWVVPDSRAMIAAGVVALALAGSLVGLLRRRTRLLLEQYGDEAYAELDDDPTSE